MSINKRRQQRISNESGQIIGLGLTGISSESADSLNTAGSIDSTARVSPSAGDLPFPLRQRILSAVRGRWWAIAIVGVLSLSALGAGLKYLEADAARQVSERNRATFLAPAQESALSKVNPFLDAPLPSATPTLSKEYVYAGSRLLAVEDAGAVNAAPSDIAVWRPSSGYWYILAPGNVFVDAGNWGIAGDIPAPGDYDGDGITDLAVYRPSTAYFYIVRSSDLSYMFVQFGNTGDVPVPADYDGDHKTDIALYRPQSGSMTNSVWYVLQSSTQTIQYYGFGISGDVPAPADYDGDGRAETAVYRPSTLNYYLVRTSDNQFQSGQVGTSSSTATPVPGDYDGDGKADFAVREGSNWIINQSSTATTNTISWQQSGDISVQNDYDGDGKCDIAVWRPSGANAGDWYIRQSSHLGQANELRQEHFGTTGDIPVPALWRR